MPRARSTPPTLLTPTRPALVLPALAALTALVLAACGGGADGEADADTDAIRLPLTGTELVAVTDTSDAPPAWLSETRDTRPSASGLCADPFATGGTTLTTTELAACQAETLGQTIGYVQTTDAGPGAVTMLRVSTDGGLAVDAHLGVARLRVVGEEWWASRDGETWLEPEEATQVSALSGVDGAAFALQRLHDPATASAQTHPLDLTVTGSAVADGTEVAILTGADTGVHEEEIAVTYYATADYVVLLARTEVTTAGGTATTVTSITDLGQPQDVDPPA